MSVDPLLRRPTNHVGYSVADLPMAVRWWASVVGAGPFFLLPPSTYDDIAHLGAPATFEHRAAFGQWGSIALELQEISHASPPRVAHALSGANPGVNHVAYLTPDLAEERARLEEFGIPAVLYARSGPVELSLHEAPALGHAVELHQSSDFLIEFFGMLERASRVWDGSQPLRDLPAS